MLGTLLAKAGISIVAKLMTEAFLSKLVVEAMRAWSKQTPNRFDDRVTEAAAEAFGVPKENLEPEAMRNVDRR